MSKQPISVTLSGENLVWLRAEAKRENARSVSELLDRLITRARAGAGAPPRESIVGTVRISADDPDLEGADALVRRLYPKARRGRRQ